MKRAARAAVIKVSRTGEVFWDGALVSREDLASRLALPATHTHGVVYYRESPEREPTAEQLDAFQAVMAGGVPVQLGMDTPSEHGALEEFTIQECPHEFLLSLVRRDPVMFACRLSPEAEVDTWVRSARLNSR